MIKILAATVVGYAAFRFLRKSKTAKVLNIKLRSIKIRPISQAALILEIINPTNESLNINSIVADVLINDFALSTINYQQATRIPANNSINLELRLKINPIEAAGFLTSLVTSKKLGVITIRGTVSGEGITAPILLTQNLTV